MKYKIIESFEDETKAKIEKLARDLSTYENKSMEEVFSDFIFPLSNIKTEKNILKKL